MIEASVYDENYYQFGPETGKSCYSRYRWMPELTIPMAMTLIDNLGIAREHSVVDFGCAYGYLVKAFRLLHRRAFGVDVSQHAIENVDPDVSRCCFLIDPKSDDYYFGMITDFCIAKDVFEHIPEEDLPGTLEKISSEELFAVIPLGEGGRFRAQANNLDITHVTCRPENWWTDLFERNMWSVVDFRFRMEGIKDSYAEKYPHAHGFWRLRSKKFWTKNR